MTTSLDLTLRIPRRGYAHGVSTGGVLLDEKLIRSDGTVDRELLKSRLVSAADRLADHLEGKL